jgi:hypothetical protein
MYSAAFLKMIHRMRDEDVRGKNRQIAVTNSSTQSCGSCAQRRRGSVTISECEESSLLMRMFSPQFVGIVLKFNGLREQLVIAVPLDKVGSAHEGAVLAGAAVVVPQIEVGKVDGMRERRPGERAVFVQAVHDVFGGENLGVGALMTCSPWS